MIGAAVIYVEAVAKYRPGWGEKKKSPSLKSKQWPTHSLQWFRCAWVTEEQRGLLGVHSSLTESCTLGPEQMWLLMTSVPTVWQKGTWNVPVPGRTHILELAKISFALRRMNHREVTACASMHLDTFYIFATVFCSSPWFLVAEVFSQVIWNRQSQP